MGVYLRDADVLVHCVLLVDLRSQSRLAVKRAHLLVDIFPVVVGHLHAAVEIVQGAVRHF